MKDLNVSEFKTRMAAYLREVKQGETIVLTEHRRPVAEVRRIDGKDSSVIPATRPFSLEGTAPKNPTPGLAASLLAQEREERWPLNDRDDR